MKPAPPPELHFAQLQVTSAFKHYLEVVKNMLSKDQAEANTKKALQGLDYAREFIKAIPEGPERAEAMHSFVSAMYSDAEMLKVTCTKGCGACCHTMPKITRDEAQLLVLILDEKPELLNGHVMERWSLQKDKDAWLQDKNPCPFLASDQSCSVYEHRPQICRAHLVKSNPLHCASHPSKEIKRVISEWAEIILSAWMNESDTGYLADLIAEEMGTA